MLRCRFHSFPSPLRDFLNAFTWAAFKWTGSFRRISEFRTHAHIPLSGRMHFPINGQRLRPPHCACVSRMPNLIVCVQNFVCDIFLYNFQLRYESNAILQLSEDVTQIHISYDSFVCLKSADNFARGLWQKTLKNALGWTNLFIFHEASTSK